MFMTREFRHHQQVILALVFAFCLAIPSLCAETVKPVAREGYSLTEERIGEDKIPAYIVSKAGTENAKRPAVILIHGGSIVDAVMTPGTPFKEEWFRPIYDDVPYGLAEKGMLVVVIDAAWAESRISPDLKQDVIKNAIMMVFTYYIKAVRDISQTIDYLSARPDVDPARIGVAGKSGGAITSLIAACEEPRIAAIVAWKGGAHFEVTAHLRGQGAGLERAFAEHPEFREKLAQADPINRLEKIPPKALALINNAKDTAMPRAGAEVLYQKLLPLYAAHPDRLQLILLETKRPTHDDQVEGFDAGRKWLEKHLLGSAANMK